MFRQIKQTLLTGKGLVRLAYRGRLGWLVHLWQDRAFYQNEALLAGMRRNRDGGGAIYNLRRNIHRIEKGLLASKPKGTFAVAYILETVDTFQRLACTGACDQNTITWASAVLNCYFAVVEHEGPIADAYSRFQSCAKPVEAPWVPYLAATRPPLTVTYDDLLTLAQRRRSIRYFQDRAVDFALIQQAMAIAALAPGACNRQSFEFLYFDDKKTIDDICQIPGGFAGYTAPGLVVVIGRYRGYFDEFDANVPIVDASLSAMSFLFALETLGLSSVCINFPMHPSKYEALRQLIALDDDEFAFMLIAVGYAEPGGKVAYSARRGIDTLLACNERIVSRQP